MEKESVLKATNIVKYFNEPEKFMVLKKINLEVFKGEFLSLTGKSGSGKSTLLYILSTMDTNYEGDLSIHGTTMRDKTQDQLAAFRNKNIGFVFQFHYLLPEFTVLKNIMLPALKLNRKTRSEIEHDAYRHLKLLDMEGQALKLSSNFRCL